MSRIDYRPGKTPDFSKTTKKDILLAIKKLKSSVEAIEADRLRLAHEAGEFRARAAKARDQIRADMRVAIGLERAITAARTELHRRQDARAAKCSTAPKNAAMPAQNGVLQKPTRTKGR